MVLMSLLLKKRLYCICGSPFHTNSAFNGAKTKLLRYYICRRSNEGRCENKRYIRNELVEDDFLKFLQNLSNEEIDVKVERNKEKIMLHEKELNQFQNRLEKEINRKKRLQLLLLDEDISRSDFEELIVDIDNSIRDINKDISNIEDEIESLNKLSLIEKEKELAIKLTTVWEDLEQLQKRELINRFIKKIVYSNKIESIDFIL